MGRRWIKVRARHSLGKPPSKGRRRELLAGWCSTTFVCESEELARLMRKVPCNNAVDAGLVTTRFSAFPAALRGVSVWLDIHLVPEEESSNVLCSL